MFNLSISSSSSFNYIHLKTLSASLKWSTKKTRRTSSHLFIDKTTSNVVTFSFNFLQGTENIGPIHIVEKLHKIRIQVITVRTTLTTEIRHACFKITNTGFRRCLCIREHKRSIVVNMLGREKRRKSRKRKRSRSQLRLSTSLTSSSFLRYSLVREKREGAPW